MSETEKPLKILCSKNVLKVSVEDKAGVQFESPTGKTYWKIHTQDTKFRNETVVSCSLVYIRKNHKYPH